MYGITWTNATYHDVAHTAYVFFDIESARAAAHEGPEECYRQGCQVSYLVSDKDFEASPIIMATIEEANKDEGYIGDVEWFEVKRNAEASS